MSISLVADVMIALLLGVTIYYCYLVNKKLSALRSGKDELKQVIEGLTVATDNAQTSVEQLKNAGREVIGNLDLRVTDGRALADELSLMIEAGNNLANRLEGSRDRAPKVGVTNVSVKPEQQKSKPLAMQSRAGGQPPLHTATAPKVAANQSMEEISDGLESELLRALRRAR
jgi:uncharacterized protein DUF6468